MKKSLSEAILLQKLLNVQGWLSEKESLLLYRAAKGNLKNGIIVEIGSWKGKSTICLSKGSWDGNRNKVIAIDPHNAPSLILKNFLNKNGEGTFKEFKKNIDKYGVKNLITPIVEDSEVAIKKISEKIDILFLDGSHHYQDEINDFEIYFPVVNEGGKVIFRCSNGKGLKKIVIQKLFFSNMFININYIDSLAIGEKCKNIGLSQFCLNRIKFLFCFIYNCIRDTFKRG